ncbi:apolipoprotein N-acyltransferase [Marinibaculum pumilum]|uniref:Apolipoprotein N-acyltransferase n=1 Tax=Marinibaculum pumilum TaxID=1766165 RepID=A0ABV7L6F5_9PROT
MSRIRAAAAALTRLNPWLRLLLAVVAGALLALAQPPLSFWPLLFPCLVLLVWLLDAAGTGASGAVLRPSAARWWRGFILVAFLWGYFAAGLYWVGIAFFVDAARFALLLPLPVIGLPLLLAVVMLAPALPFLWHWPWDARRVLLLALALAAGDYLRSFLFTGFPWNLFGYVWLGADPVLQSAGWIGIHGLGLLTLALGGMPAILADPVAAAPRGGAATWLAAMAALFVAIAAFGIWRLAAHPEAPLTDLRLQIVQANVPQKEKWHPATRDSHFLRSIALTRDGQAEAVDPAADAPPDLVIWSETAVPFFLANEPARRAQLAAAVPPGGRMIVGAPRFARTAPGTEAMVWNSLHVVGPGGGILATYDKRHLVPFGEFLPLRGLLSRLGLDNLAQGGTDFTTGTVPGVVAASAVPPFRALICYEGIFPAEISEGPQRPAWLLNITNDAWFGESSGPYQHFGMTRLRAIEQGLPVVRAANTGISAIIDPYGRVLARLGLGRTGVLEGRLPAPLPVPPPYARLGDWLSLLPVLLAVAALLLAAPRGIPGRGRRE